MKFPRTPFAVAALFVAAAIMTSCGSSPSANFQQHLPPPPPTGNNYTTCNSQLVPNWQSTNFISNYQPAIAALVSHYGSNANIGYIRIGLGRGGEINLPQGWNSGSDACSGGYQGLWGYTVGGSSPNSSTWNTYLADMVTYEHSLNSQKELLVSITPVNGTQPNTATPDFIAPLAVQNGLSYGNQGLESSDITNFNSEPCGGDWCNLFATVPPAIAELQTIGPSCPTGVACSGQQASTGPLPPLLPFATAHGSNDLELYYQDWLIAYDSAYASSVGVDSTQAAQYKLAIQTARATGATMEVLFPPQSGATDFAAVQQFLINNPDVDGAVIAVSWSDFDIGNSGNTAHASYDFSTITDAAIQPWIQAGKTVNLVLQNTTYGGSGSCPPDGIGSNGNEGSNCAMPPYMWNVLK